ncbi:MAG: RNA polymerase sigma factor, partial [Acidobacteriota bacterium]|nr:RNA polymerase sigma factor [Acidobacteriota bacterium]
WVGGAFLGCAMERADYDRVVREHKDRVHSYAAWMLKDAEDARDVAQDALIRLWTHRESVRLDSVKSWLLKTVHNLSIDRIRRRKTRAETDVDDLTTMVDDTRPGPEQTARGGEVGRIIGKALTTLSDRDRSMVLMREVHGLTYNEIAENVELPLGTVKAALHRARERLRRELVGAGVRP